MVPETAFSFVEIEISDTQGHMKVDPEALARLARRVLTEEGVGRASISIALVDDPTIQVMNRRHLAHDWPTDVISFRLSEPGDATLSGEVIVSAEMAATTAREAGVDPWSELALYVVHGLLHFCGFDDSTDDEAARIRRREDEILTGEGLTNTFPMVRPSGAIAEGRESERWAN
jgi:probable rRNA maturation factor